MTNSIKSNLILNTDSYKFSHHLQLPPDTTHMVSYIESRGGRWDETVMAGTQMFLMEYLSSPITREDIDEAESFIVPHGFEFNRAGWEHILEKHGGFLPIRIDALPEGTVVPTRNVLMRLVNTDPMVPWLTAYVETAILRAIWYPTSVATLSHMIKRHIWNALLESSDDPAGQILFKLHDFGSRGVSSKESAGIGGIAHLFNFRGTDTVEALRYGRKYYKESMAGFSIPAAEHSTVTSWGGRDFESRPYNNMINQFAKPGSIFAVVSDSYDIYNAVAKIWGDTLKEKVISSGATLVVRPDSGDPTTVPVEVIKILAEKFGYTLNSKGYRVLHPSVRVIQGDGINEDSIQTILKNVMDAGFSVDNIAFGMGGQLLQGVNRDTLKFAMKTSAAKVNGEWREVFKDPITDKGKASKKGVLNIRQLENKGWTTEQINFDDIDHVETELVKVFENGVLHNLTTLAEIRGRVDRVFG